MISASQAEVRPATTTHAPPPYNNNANNSHNALPGKFATNSATTHDNHSIADPTSTVSDDLLENKTRDGDMALVTPLTAAANAMELSSPEMTDLASNAHLVSMGVAWQAMYQQQQQQHQLSTFKIRPFPVPPSITIPPPHPSQTLFADMDVSMTPHELGKLSPVFSSNGFPDGGLFALSPQHCQQLASGSGSIDGASQVSSPVKVNAVLRPKPVATSADGALPGSDASPGLPTVGKDLQFNTRYLSESWAFDASPANVYAMLLHQPQPLDLSYQQQMTAAMLTPQQQQQHINPQIQLQLESQMQHSSLGIQTTSPLNARMHQVYPQMSPTMAISPHQMQLTMPSQHTTGGAFSPTVNLSMINFSELMILAGSGGGGGGSGENPGLFSPTSNILKHMLPPVAPHHGGVHVKDITLNELRPHFNKPMAVVAKELGVCITLMKKICRRNGLVRWPHRRIRSLVNRITSLQVIAAATTDAEKKRFESQIAVLREELSAVIQNPNEKSRKAQADAKARSPSSSSLMAVKDEDLDDGDDDGGDCEESEQRVHQDSADTFISVTSSGGCEQEPPTTSVGSDAVKATPSTFESLVHRKMKESKCADVDMQAQKASDTIREPRVVAAAAAGDSKKRKGALLQQFGGAGGAPLYPPPPIKIPCYRDVRMRRNSAPEQQHLRALGRDASDADLERPSSTMSNKRGSISSILCDSAE